MVLSSGTFLGDDFLANISFLSLVHYSNLTKDYYFSMGYLNNDGDIRAFELRFDDEEEAKTCREEVLSKVLLFNDL